MQTEDGRHVYLNSPNARDRDEAQRIWDSLPKCSKCNGTGEIDESDDLGPIFYKCDACAGLRKGWR